VKRIGLLDSFKSKKFRYGGYATLMVVIAIAIVIAINLLVDLVPLRLDMTQNQLYSISDQTKQVLSKLKADVTIATISKVGQENAMIKEVLAKYTAISKKVKLTNVDPERNPGWSKQYDKSGGGLREGTLVVISGSKFKTIEQWDLYDYSQQDQNSQPQASSLRVEQRVTSAIQFVTAEKNITVYNLQDHGEESLSGAGLLNSIENENFATKDLALLTLTAVPSDADIVTVLAPKSDLTQEDAEKLRTYLKNGGRMVIALDLMEKPFSNFLEVLSAYGIRLDSVLVVEGDSQHYVNTPFWLVPKMEFHDILSPLSSKNMPILFPQAQAISVLDLRKKSLKQEPLLRSTENSWAKTSWRNLKSLAKEKGDIDGPLTVAMAITDPASADPTKSKDTKLVVFGSSAFLGFQDSAPGNLDLFMNSLNWLRDQKEDITIRAKNLMQFRLRINEFQSLLFSGIVVILMPLLVFGWGLVTWLRRRHL
jgi:ABC-2 type transport system permease protein